MSYWRIKTVDQLFGMTFGIWYKEVLWLDLHSRKSAVAGECIESGVGGCEDHQQGAKGPEDTWNGEKRANSRDSNETVIWWKHMLCLSVACQHVKNGGWGAS